VLRQLRQLQVNVDLLLSPFCFVFIIHKNIIYTNSKHFVRLRFKNSTIKIMKFTTSSCKDGNMERLNVHLWKMKNKFGVLFRSLKSADNVRQQLCRIMDRWMSYLGNSGNIHLKGVFAKNERGYRLTAINKRFWSLLILLLSVASIRRKL